MGYTRADYEQAAAVIRERTDRRPVVGLVLGSGLGQLAETIDNPVVMPYADIPGFPVSTVQGHSGQLLLGELEGRSVVVQQGRAHFYEGYDQQKVTFPIRVMQALGVSTLILTNAAGGLNASYAVGDLMLLNDHINLAGMVGNNPLMGPNDESLGPRFLGMAQTYDQALRGLARAAASAAEVTLHEGVYVYLSGPTFETPAECRMLRMMGADAVGMSTVPEVLAARHGGLRVLAFSGITNQAIMSIDAGLEANHEEVLEAGKLIAPRLTQVLRGVLQKL